MGVGNSRIGEENLEWSVQMQPQEVEEGKGESMLLKKLGQIVSPKMCLGINVRLRKTHFPSLCWNPKIIEVVCQINNLESATFVRPIY